MSTNADIESRERALASVRAQNAQAERAEPRMSDGRGRIPGTITTDRAAERLNPGQSVEARLANIERQNDQIIGLLKQLVRQT